MPRKSNNATANTVQEENMTSTETTPISDELEQDLDVETVEPDEAEETVDSAEASAKEEKPTQPKRGDLPEGYITPIQFAKVVSREGLHTKRDGSVDNDVKPQMIYSYMKNAPKDDPFPIEEVKDSNGNTRQALQEQAGIDWWKRKNERAAGRAANAKAKAEKKAAAGKVTQQGLVETGEADPSSLEPAEEAE